jgi:hypothetical protein
MKELDELSHFYKTTKRNQIPLGILLAFID